MRRNDRGHWSGDRKQTTLWTIPAREDRSFGHGTQKPVECMKRPIENNSSPGQASYEPFSGSGTTIVAGEMTGRCVHAIELNPAYVDVAVTRWQNFTGLEAKLETTDRSFSETATERQQQQDASAGSATCGTTTGPASRVDLLSEPAGQGVAALGEALGWLPHTVRAALTRLRQNGFALGKNKDEAGTTVYRIEASAEPTCSASKAA